MPSKPETTIVAGLAVGTIVVTLYSRGLPNNADIRVGEVGEEKIESVRKQNAWMAAATVAGISLLAKDAGIFVMGGAMVVALDWMVRVNNWTNPLTNSARSSDNASAFGIRDAGETAPAETAAYGDSDLGVVA
jgi:hypothetical protein